MQFSELLEYWLHCEMFFLPNSVDLMTNLLLLMGLRNVETWILQFTNFFYDVIAPDLKVYILEQKLLVSLVYFGDPVQKSLWAVWAEQLAPWWFSVVICKYKPGYIVWLSLYIF